MPSRREEDEREFDRQEEFRRRTAGLSFWSCCGNWLPQRPEPDAPCPNCGAI